MKIYFDEEIIKTSSDVINEDKIELFISKKVKKMEKFSIVGVENKTKLEVFYEGTIKEYKCITRGEVNSWIEYSDYSPSYGSGTYSQRYSRDLDWFNDVITPVIIHCKDGTIEEDRHYEGKRESTWS